MPVQPRCEHLPNPEAVEAPFPRLTWQLESA